MTATTAMPWYKTRLIGWREFGKLGSWKVGEFELPNSPTPHLALVEQPQRHHQAEICARFTPALRLQRRRSFRRAECELHLIGRDVAKNLEQVRRVESDVERIAVVANRHLVVRLAKVGRLHAETEQTRVERETNTM